MHVCTVCMRLSVACEDFSFLLLGLSYLLPCFVLLGLCNWTEFWSSCVVGCGKGNRDSYWVMLARMHNPASYPYRLSHFFSQTFAFT